MHTGTLALSVTKANIFLGFLLVASVLIVTFIILSAWMTASKIRARKREIESARDISEVKTEVVQLLGVLDARDLVTGGPNAIFRVGSAFLVSLVIVGGLSFAATHWGTQTQSYVDQARGYLFVRYDSAHVPLEDDFISWTTTGSASTIEGSWYVYVRPAPHTAEPQPQTFLGTIDGAQVTLRVTSAVAGACGVRVVTGQLVGLGQEELDLYDYRAATGQISRLVAQQSSYDDFATANQQLSGQ